MRDPAYGTKAQIVVEGNRLPVPFDDQVVMVVVDQDLTSPGSCEIRVADGTRSFLSSTKLELGQQVRIEASPVADEAAEPIFEGIVHAIDVTYDEEGQSVVIVAFDESYALTQTRLSRSYADVTAADVVAELCGELGLSVGQTDLTSVVFPHLGPFDETPWDFIARHAAESGCFVRFHDGSLEVLQPAPASAGPEPGDHGATDATQLVPGHNLTQLRLHVTSARQVGEVEVRGWDPSAKEHLAGPAAAKTVVNTSNSDPATVGRTLGAEVLIDAQPSLNVQVRCDHRATALGSWLASQHLAADGEAIGNPALMAGEIVSVGAADTLSGRYLLTQCRHRFDTDGYTTEFRCTGLHDRSLLGLVGQRPQRRLEGVYPAVVTDIADPDELGRVRLKFPWLDDQYESGWSRVSQVGAGPERGLHWYPEVNDEVLVAFLDGRSESPIVLGGLYNGVDAPPFTPYVNDGGEVKVRGFKTRTGHVLELIDEQGEESIRLHTADGQTTLHLDQANKKASLTSGEVSLELDAGGSSASLSSTGDVTISAKGNLNLEASAQVVVKGATINLN